MKSDFRVYVNGKPYGFINDQDAEPEIVAIPEGNHVIPEVPLVPKLCHHCQADVLVLMGRRKTYQVNVHGHADATGTIMEFCRFCSVRCMAEWLAVELAKEEDHGSSHHQ